MPFSRVATASHAIGTRLAFFQITADAVDAMSMNTIAKIIVIRFFIRSPLNYVDFSLKNCIVKDMNSLIGYTLFKVLGEWGVVIVLGCLAVIVIAVQKIQDMNK